MTIVWVYKPCKNYYFFPCTVGPHLETPPFKGRWFLRRGWVGSCLVAGFDKTVNCKREKNKLKSPKVAEIFCERSSRIYSRRINLWGGWQKSGHLLRKAFPPCLWDICSFCNAKVTSQNLKRREISPGTQISLSCEAETRDWLLLSLWLWDNYTIDFIIATALFLNKNWTLDCTLPTFHQSLYL